MSSEQVREIGVIGGGLIGRGVAQHFAQAGYRVGLYNRSTDSSRRALAAISSGLQRQVKYGLTTPQLAEAALERVTGEVDLGRVAERSDFIIEAVSEDLSLKKEIFSQLDALSRPDVILATDTSGLSISEIANATRRPDKVIGTHHFNPVPLIPGVEVIPGEHTSELTIKRTIDLLRQAGKRPALVRDVPGFVAVRLSSALRREAWALVEQGVATPEVVDTVWLSTVGRSFAAHGPLHSSDASGLDVLLSVHEYVEQALTPPSSPSELVREKVREGHLGVKSGRGFYEWTPERLAAQTERRERMLASLLRDADT